MFTIEQVAQRYGVTQHTVLGWVRAGEMRAVNVGRRPGGRRPRWRITQAALDEFEAGRTAAAPPPRAVRRKNAGDVIAFY